jgi:acylphosphatase
MGSDRVRARVIVSGVVQGVFFRASTRDEAHRLGVSGWVRNLPDGEVEAVFEGPKPLVDRAIEWTRGGPPSAVVQRVEVHWETPSEETGFSLRR